MYLPVLNEIPCLCVVILPSFLAVVEFERQHYGVNTGNTGNMVCYMRKFMHDYRAGLIIQCIVFLTSLQAKDAEKEKNKQRG